MDYVALFNEITNVIKIVGAESCKAASLEVTLETIALHSLDTVMLGVFLGELFGIDEEVAKDMPIGSLKEIFDFVVANKTTEPESIEAAVEAIK